MSRQAERQELLAGDVDALVERQIVELLDRFHDGQRERKAREIVEKVVGPAITSLRTERDEARAESHELTKALTGLTCGGSEFFIRKGGRYLADIVACVDWVRRRDQSAAQRALTAMHEKKAAEARALKAEAENAWKPIESAPRDGTHVLLGGGCYVFEGRWLHEEVYRSGGWYELNNDPSDSWGGEMYPTHWMPLPSPPSESQ